MRRLAALVLVLAAVIVVTIVVLVRQGSTSTPASVPAQVRGTLAPDVLPRPGVYRYVQSGFEEAKAGPLKIHRRFPATGVLVVSGSGHLEQQEWRYSKQHLEAMRYRSTPSGLLLTWQRTRITIVITQDEAHPARPVTVWQPAKLHVGQRWVQDYTVGDVHSVSRNLVTGRCGPGCFVIVADSTVTGLHPGTEHDVTWTSVTTGLTLRETIDRRIGGSFPYRMKLSIRLAS
ncbi:MAG: hypothetical protein ACXVQQ_03790 [Gaiellaceae bacterium]